MNTQLAAAYAACRGIARGSARNFYYAFLMLPREKRNALCAIYSFMRHADDIADHPTLAREEKLAQLAEWRRSLHSVLAGDSTDDPVLFALEDTQRRFQVPLELYDQLIEGTIMDVPPEPGQLAGSAASTETDLCLTFASYDDLYRYCYHVASVVGLVTIRIFGYRDPAAETLAERCGVAFQLTNILRDVKEDAAMRRVYLPREDMALFGRSPEELAPACLNNGFEAKAFRPVLQLLAGRARQCYRSADELLPLIDEDCQPALWGLVEIYRRLLARIEARGYDVFTERIQLGRFEKLTILARGMLHRLVA